MTRMLRAVLRAGFFAITGAAAVSAQTILNQAPPTPIASIPTGIAESVLNAASIGDNLINPSLSNLALPASQLSGTPSAVFPLKTAEDAQAITPSAKAVEPVRIQIGVAHKPATLSLKTGEAASAAEEQNSGKKSGSLLQRAMQWFHGIRPAHASNEDLRKAYEGETATSKEEAVPVAAEPERIPEQLARFEYYPPFSETNHPNFANVNFQSIPVPPGLEDMGLPADFRIKDVFKWNTDSLGLAASYQIVIAKGDQIVAQITFQFDPHDNELYVKNMETVPGARRNGIASSLLRAAGLMTADKAEKLDFSLDAVNNQLFTSAIEKGASLEQALGKTTIGRYARAQGFSLKTFASSPRMKQLREEFRTHTPPKYYEKVDHPYFWFEK
jgi:hypothetical protein